MWKHRFWILLTGSALIFALSLYGAYALRWDFTVPEIVAEERNILLLWFVPFKLLILSFFRQLDALPAYFGWADVKRICWALAVSASVLFLLYAASGGMSIFAPPRSIIILDAVVSAVGLFSLRYALNRVSHGATELLRRERDVEPVAIVGAGEAGALFVSNLRHQPRLHLQPVCFLDDKEAKHGAYLHNLPILGRPEDLAELKERYAIERVVIAMPSASAQRIREVIRIAVDARCRIDILPGLDELASGKSRITDLRTPQIEDILGRPEVQIDQTAIRQLIEGKTVLVTGAGGSIGSELARQLAFARPARLQLWERSEYALYQIEENLRQVYPELRLNPHLLDLQNEEAVERLLGSERPDIIFHAAAHKHVPITEREPEEAIRNNTLATAKLVRLARQLGVPRLVFISTDKAVNPVNILGASKRMAEIAVQAGCGELPYSSVRFGNVLNSSGSVVPLFRDQIARGGPVTVTDPEVARYFMTIPEAVGLVLQCAALGEPGGIFVLDMGEPVKIVDLARQMIQLSGYRPDIDIPIVFTGLRPGEKLREELYWDGETHTATAHPQIRRFTGKLQPAAEVDAFLQELEASLGELSGEALHARLTSFLPEYRPEKRVIAGDIAR